MNLTWSDVDLGKRLVKIQSHGSFKTKWGKKRILPLNDIAMRVVSELAQKRIGEYVFNIGGRKVRQPWVTRSFKKYIRRLGLKEDYHFHHLRHTFASWLAQNGAPIYEIQKLLGHSNIRVTEIYSHLAPEQLHGTVGILTKQMALN